MTKRKSIIISAGLHRKALKIAGTKGNLSETYRKLYRAGREQYDGKSLPSHSVPGDGSLPRKIDAEIVDECDAIGKVHDRSASYVFRQLCLAGLGSLANEKTTASKE